MRKLYVILLLLSLSACALGEASPPTQSPPITLGAPPPLALTGDCATTSGLDGWLQSTEFYIAEFTKEVNGAANQPQGALFEPVVRMARLRDAASELTTPDCAVSTHLLLVETMNMVVENFQAYANQERDNLGNTVADAISRIDRVVAGHNELKARLEAQYRGGQP